MTGIWQGLINQPLFSTGTMILLTDGRIMVQEGGSNHWHALKPDSSGSYLNGTWSALADSIHSRLYYASGVLKDARVIFCGGEYSDAGGDTNACEIYDPVTNTWSAIPPPPGWAIVGDAVCCVLPDGRFMIGALATPACIIYDPTTNSWSPAANKAIRSNEETWVLLQDNTILTAQCFAPYKSEKYIIASNTWKDEGVMPVTLVNPNMAEIGPAMVLYNGKVIYFGAEKVGGFGKTAIYTLPATAAGTGTWVAGPNIPKIAGKTMVSNDCPATLMPNGKVLFTVSEYISNSWGSPIFFFEYDPVSNTITQAPTPINNVSVLYESRLMLLPSGEVMFSPSSNNVEIYIPDGGPQDSWKPAIDSVAPHVTGSSAIDYYILKGTQLNGLSQANMYGDDCYAATNYPLVRLRNTCSNKIYYCRTFNFSTMGVATGSTIQCCNFSGAGIPEGEYELVVVANGISSLPVTVKLPMPLDKECCSCSEISINLPVTCEECIAPPAPDWVNCDECMKWYFADYVMSKEVSIPTGEFKSVVRIQFEIVYEHCLKYRGRQQGKLLFTTSLIPKEEIRIFQSDRYRKTTSETSRVSVNTSFRQSVSAVFRTYSSGDVKIFSTNIDKIRTDSASAPDLLNVLTFGLLGSGPSVSDSVSSSQTQTNIEAVSGRFSEVLSSASTLVEAERSLVISTFEDKEHVEITSRVLKNNNDCRAITYYIRRVNEVYDLHTTIKSIRYRIYDVRQNHFSDWHDISDLNGLSTQLVNFIKSEADKLPKIGSEVKGASCISIPTDGSVYEAELAHCSSCDPEREAQLLIALEKSKNESRKLCMEAELLEMEVQRRKALIAKGDLSSFDAAPAAPGGQ